MNNNYVIYIRHLQQCSQLLLSIIIGYFVFSFLLKLIYRKSYFFKSRKEKKIMNENVKYHIEKSESEDCYYLIYDETRSVTIKYLDSEFNVDIKSGTLGAKIENLKSIEKLTAFFSNSSVCIPSNVTLSGDIALLFCPSFEQHDPINIINSVIVSGKIQYSRVINSVLLNNDLLMCGIDSSTMEFCQCEDFVFSDSTIKRTDATHGKINNSDINCCTIEDVNIYGSELFNSKVCAGSVSKSKIVDANVCQFIVQDSIIKNVRLLSGSMNNIPIRMANIQEWLDFGCIGRYFFYKQVDHDKINHVVISEHSGTYKEQSFAKKPLKMIRVSVSLKSNPISVFVYENFSLISKVAPDKYLNSSFNALDEKMKAKMSDWFSVYFHFLTEYILDITSNYSVVSHLQKKQYVDDIVTGQMSVDLKTRKLIPRHWTIMDEDTLSIVPKSMQKESIERFCVY